MGVMLENLAQYPFVELRQMKWGEKRSQEQGFEQYTVHYGFRCVVCDLNKIGLKVQEQNNVSSDGRIIDLQSKGFSHKMFE